jgi:hypothetical protein
MRTLGRTVEAEARSRQNVAVLATAFQLYALTHEQMRAKMTESNAIAYEWIAKELVKIVPAKALAYRLDPVRNRAKTSHLSIRCGYGYGNRFGMDIHAQKSYLLFHNRLLPLVALYCGSLRTHKPIPRSAHRAGHSIMTVSVG